MFANNNNNNNLQHSFKCFDAYCQIPLIGKIFVHNIIVILKMAKLGSCLVTIDYFCRTKICVEAYDTGFTF